MSRAQLPICFESKHLLVLNCCLECCDWMVWLVSLNVTICFPFSPFTTEGLEMRLGSSVNCTSLTFHVLDLWSPKGWWCCFYFWLQIIKTCLGFFSYCNFHSPSTLLLLLRSTKELRFWQNRGIYTMNVEVFTENFYFLSLCIYKKIYVYPLKI